MHVIENLFRYMRAKNIEKEPGLAKLLQKQNGANFLGHSVDAVINCCWLTNESLK